MRQSTGEIMTVPDDMTDEQILAPLQAQAVQSPFGIAANLARSSLEQYLNRPQSTLPNLGASDVMGLTPEQVTNTQSMIQQSNQQTQNLSFAEKARQRQQMMVELENEKDRQQQLKLEDTRFRNEQMVRKQQERAILEQARLEAESKKYDTDEKFKNTLAIEDYRQQNKLELEKFKVQNRPARAGAGGAAGGKAPMVRNINGTPAVWDETKGQFVPVPLSMNFPAPQGKGESDPLREKAIDRMVEMQENKASIPEIIEMLDFYGDSTKDIIEKLRAKQAATEVDPESGGNPISNAIGGVKNFLWGGNDAPIAPPISATASGKAETGRQTGTSKSTGKRMTRIFYSDGTHQDIEG